MVSYGSYPYGGSPAPFSGSPMAQAYPPFATSFSPMPLVYSPAHFASAPFGYSEVVSQPAFVQPAYQYSSFPMQCMPSQLAC